MWGQRLSRANTCPSGRQSSTGRSAPCTIIIWSSSNSASDAARKYPAKVAATRREVIPQKDNCFIVPTRGVNCQAALSPGGRKARGDHEENLRGLTKCEGKACAQAPARIERGHIHQPQVAPEHPIPADAFVVVQEIAATVEGQTIIVNLGGLHMM